MAGAKESGTDTYIPVTVKYLKTVDMPTCKCPWPLNN